MTKLIDFNKYGSVINWFIETALKFKSCPRNLYLKVPSNINPDFEQVRKLVGKEFLDSVIFIDFTEIEQLANDYYENIAVNFNFNDYSVDNCLINQSQILILYNYCFPKSSNQIWFLNNYILYPRLKFGKSTIFISSFDFEDIKNISFEQFRTFKFIDAIKVDTDLFFKQSKPPALIQAEYNLIQKLHEKKININLGLAIDGNNLDIAANLNNNNIWIKIHAVSHFDNFNNQISDNQKIMQLLAKGWNIINFTIKDIERNVDECSSIVESVLRQESKKNKYGRLIDAKKVGDNKFICQPDKYQQLAIDHKSGPLLVTGISGCGKTTTIVNKLIDLIQNGINPERILVLFHSSSNLKYCQNLFRQKFDKNMITKLNLMTFYDFGMKFVKENTSSIKRKMPVKIETNSLKLIVKILNKFEKDLDPQYKEVFFDIDEFIIQSVISFYKLNLLSPENVKQTCKTKIDELVYKIYASYEEQLLRSNKIDNDDLLKLPAQLMLTNSTIANVYQNLYDYILCDDYQEINLAADSILNLLSCPYDNLSVFADPVNCLNESNGSLPALTNTFGIRYPNFININLNNSWRMPEIILNLAKKIIPKISLTTQNFDDVSTNEIIKNEVGFVETKNFSNEILEANWICDEIQTLLDTGRNPDEIAVLFRNPKYGYLISDRLDELKIKFNILNINKELIPDEEADLTALLKLIYDPDSPKTRELFEKVIHIKLKDIDSKILQEISSFAETNNLSYLKAIEIYFKLNKDATSNELANLVNYIFKTNKQNLSPLAAVNSICDKFKLKDYYSSIKLPNDLKYEPFKKIENLKIISQKYNSLFEFIDYLNKSNSSDSNQTVNLLNIHESLGIEFSVVFIPGLVQGYFPSLESENLLEELRLFYTSISRTSDILYLTYPNSIDNKVTQPSEFLNYLKLNFRSVSLNQNTSSTVKNDTDKQILIKESNIATTKITSQDSSLNNVSNKSQNTIVNKSTEQNQIEQSNDQISQKTNLLNEVQVPIDISESDQSNQPKTLNMNDNFILNNVTPDHLLQTYSIISNSKKIIDNSQIKDSKIHLSIQDNDKNETQISNFDSSDNDVLELNNLRIAKNDVQNREILYCPGCNMPIAENSQFCGECGFKLSRQLARCNKCHEPLVPGSKFCGECGNRTL